MKTFKKLLFLTLLLGAVLLAGCARSELTLTVNEDGSFDATVNYRIIKEKVSDSEVLSQTKSIITDSLEQNNIPYTETEDNEYVTVTVQRSFADLTELTSQEAWKGISFVPSFVTNEDGQGLWTRYEDGRLAISGTLDVDSFGARDIAGNFTDYSGSLRISLPSEAEVFSGGEADGDGYIWSGSAEDSLSVDIKSQQIFSDLALAQATKTASAEKAKKETSAKKTPAKKSESSASIYWIIPIVVVGAAALAALVFVLIKKKNKKQ